jgi:hypothetical protein
MTKHDLKFLIFGFLSTQFPTVILNKFF